MEYLNDLVNEMVVEYARDMSSFDIDSAEVAIKLISEGSLIDSLIPSTDNFRGYIDTSIEHISVGSDNISRLLVAYDKLTTSTIVDTKEIEVTEQLPDDISKFRPEQLEMIPIEFDSTIRKVISGTLKPDDVKSIYLDGPYFKKIRKNLVKTSLPLMTTKEYVAKFNRKHEIITSEYIRNVILPFLRSYIDETRNLTSIGMNIKGILVRTESSMRASIASINVLKNDPDLGIKTLQALSYIQYNMYRRYFDLCAYLTSMYMRKCCYYSYNIRSFTTALSEINSELTDDESSLVESYMDTHFSDYSDEDILYSMLNNGFNIINPALSHVVGMIDVNLNRDTFDTVEVGYNDSVYRSVVETLVSIGKSFNSMIRDILQNNEGIDTILDKHGFSDSLISKYSEILSSLSHDDYEEFEYNNTVINSIVFKELHHLSANTNNIARHCVMIHQLFKRGKQLFCDGNSHGLDEASYDEYCDIINRLVDDLDNFITVIGKRIIDRMNMLIDLVQPPSRDASEPEPLMQTDYTSDAPLSEIDEIEFIEQVRMENIYRKYMKHRAHSDLGSVLVFEDGEQTSSVQTDAKSQHSGGNEKQQFSIKGLWEKLLAVWEDIKKKFTGNTDKNFEKFNGWIGRIKERVLGIDYSNTTINIAAYSSCTMDKIVSDINFATGRIKNLNVNSIPSELKTKDGAEKYLFDPIPDVIGKNTKFKDRIYAFYVFGNNAEQNLTKYEGDGARTKVEEMIAFCENYKKMTVGVTRALDGLNKAAYDKQRQLVEEMGKTPTSTVQQKPEGKPEEKPAEKPSPDTAEPKNESVTVFEAGSSVKVDGKRQKADKGDSDKANISSNITSTVKIYMMEILTVMEKKYLDYVKTLGKLAPSDDGKPTEQEQEDQGSDNPDNKDTETDQPKNEEQES